MNKLSIMIGKMMNMLGKPVLFDGDPVGTASSLLTTAYNHLKTLATPVAILMIGFCAFKLFVASDPQSVKQAKSWLITIIVALALLYLAGPIVTMVTSSFAG